MRAGRKRMGGGTRLVLVVGEDAAVLCLIQGRRILGRALAANPADTEALAAFQRLLARAPRAPVRVMIDTLDLTLRRDTLPRANPLDTRALVRRRLASLFPGATLTGAAREGAGAWLLVQVAETAALAAWLAWVRDLGRPVRDVVLLPLEAATLVARLAPLAGWPPLPPQGREGRGGWRVLVGRHLSGGLRLVVLRAEGVVLTRLMPDPGAAAPEALATALAEHVQATLDYLRRQGYRPGDPLEMMVLGDEALESALAGVALPPGGVAVLDPVQVGARLGWQGMAVPGGAFADLLHALALGPRPRLRLRPPTLAPQARDRRQRRLAVATTMGILALGGLLLGPEVIHQQHLTAQLAALTRQRDALRRQQATLPASTADEDTIRLAETFTALEAAQTAPWSWLAVLPSVMGPGEVVAGLDFEALNAVPLQPVVAAGRTHGGGGPLPPGRGRLRLTVRFTPPQAVQGQPPALGPLPATLAMARELRRRLSAALPEAHVSLVEGPVPLDPATALAGTTGVQPLAEARPTTWTVTLAVEES